MSAEIVGALIGAVGAIIAAIITGYYSAKTKATPKTASKRPRWRTTWETKAASPTPQVGEAVQSPRQVTDTAVTRRKTRWTFTDIASAVCFLLIVASFVNIPAVPDSTNTSTVASAIFGIFLGVVAGIVFIAIVRVVNWIIQTKVSNSKTLTILFWTSLGLAVAFCTVILKSISGGIIGGLVFGLVPAISFVLIGWAADWITRKVQSKYES